MSRSRSLMAVLALAIGLAVLPAISASAATTHWVRGSENNPAPPGKNCGNAGYTSIQDAVDAAASGDTVMVCAGEYDEQVVINAKDITLQGSGDGAIIRPSSPAVLASFYTYPAGCFWMGSTISPVVFVRNSASTSVQDLRIEGINLTTPGPGASRLSGVLFGESGGEISNLTINDIKTANYALRTYVIDVSACNVARAVDVIGNTVNDFSRAAIQVQGDDLTATVNENKITGPGTIGPANVPNGIVFIGDATGVADSNYLTKMHHTGTSALAGALFAFAADDPAGVTFSNNEAHDVDDGVLLASDSKHVIVGPGNYLHKNLKGVQIESRADLNMILNNRIHQNSIVGIQVHGPLAVPPGTTSGPNNEAHCNSIWGNTDGVLNFNTFVFNAELNWWGHPTGPSGAGPGKGDTVTANVDFTPWLTSPPHSGDCP